jgi:hypothetical protein
MRYIADYRIEENRGRPADVDIMGQGIPGVSEECD